MPTPGLAGQGAFPRVPARGSPPRSTGELLNLALKHSQHGKEFPQRVWQSGFGNQSNMNMNEVPANRASELLGGIRGDGRLVYPNDEVNITRVGPGV